MSAPRSSRRPQPRRSNRAVAESIARAVIKEHELDREIIAEKPSLAFEAALTRVIIKGYGVQVLASIIAARPHADLYAIHNETWLGKKDSGPELLRRIAATVLVVIMQELLEAAAEGDPA